MSNDATLGSLVTWARDLARLPKGGPVSAERWKKFVNQGLSELHYILAETHADWLEGEQSVTLVADQKDYPLKGVYKPVSADYETGGVNYNIARFMLSERNDRQEGTGWVGSTDGFRLRIVGNVMRLQPIPSGSGTVTLKHIPAFRPLESEDESVHQSIPQGWEEMAAWSAAWRAAVVEGDPGAVELKAGRDEFGQRIGVYASERHAGEPSRVVNQRGSAGRRLLHGW